jgi:hypothetical protein
MANFTLETSRNQAFQNIPRLTFQLPQSTTGVTPSTTSPILFCQTGCDLEFKFKNITNATLKNDGNFFTITPPDNSDNYINWNGTGKDGLNMIRFNLKEVKFSAPARDIVGSISYNKSIQIYFTFVNSDPTKRDIMIVITIIGQANNVGNSQTDGFILLNALTNQIPLRNDVKNVTNLGNVNLGNLLPANKSFFNTLINGNSIQYISMARIIDIPQDFLNNMISRVLGGQQAYQLKVNQNTQQIPSNPEGTFIFYSENIKTIGADQAYVCNANCDRVVGDSKLLIPKFGASTTTTTSSTTTRTVGGKPSDTVKEEVCEEEYVFPGTRTNVRIKSATVPATSADTTKQKEISQGEFTNAIVISLFIVLIFICVAGILYALAKAADLSGIRSFFSRELWNISNVPLLISTIIGFCSIIIFTSFALDIMVKQNKIENFRVRFRSKFSSSDENEKLKKPWIFLIIGYSIYILCLTPLIIIAYRKKINPYGNLSSSFTDINKYSSFKTRPNFTIPMDSNLTQFKKIPAFTTQTDKILTDYKKSPTDYLSPGSKGVADILEASKKYSELSPLAKESLTKSNPSIVDFLKPNSEFIKDIQSKTPQQFPGKPTLDSFIDNLSQYNKFSRTPAIITQDLLDSLTKYQVLVKNKNLDDIIKSLKVGDPIPLKLNQYATTMKTKF